MRQHGDTMLDMKNLRQLGPRGTAAFAGVLMALFFFCWNLRVDNETLGGALVGAVVAGVVAGGLFFWMMNAAPG